MSRWWRAHASALDDPKVQRLHGDMFKSWFNILCIASLRDGILPPIADIAFALRKSEKDTVRVVSYLTERGLLDVTDNGLSPHNWNGRQYKSDVSTKRVTAFRERQRNVSVTPSETDSDTEQISDKNSVAKATGGEPPDVATVIFGNGLTWLKQTSGRADTDCRSLLGKWRKSLGDEALIAALGRAQREGALDPVGWIEGAVRARTTKPAKVPMQI